MNEKLHSIQEEIDQKQRSLAALIKREERRAKTQAVIETLVSASLRLAARHPLGMLAGAAYGVARRLQRLMRENEEAEGMPGATPDNELSVRIYDSSDELAAAEHKRDEITWEMSALDAGISALEEEIGRIEDEITEVCPGICRPSPARLGSAA